MRDAHLEPREEQTCPECDAVVVSEGDRYEWSVECTNEDCGWSDGWSHPDL